LDEWYRQANNIPLLGVYPPLLYRLVLRSNYKDGECDDIKEKEIECLETEVAIRDNPEIRKRLDKLKDK
jgi:hypothetical protein